MPFGELGPRPSKAEAGRPPFLLSVLVWGPPSPFTEETLRDTEAWAPPGSLAGREFGGTGAAPAAAGERRGGGAGGRPAGGGGRGLTPNGPRLRLPRPGRRPRQAGPPARAAALPGSRAGSEAGGRRRRRRLGWKWKQNPRAAGPERADDSEAAGAPPPPPVARDASRSQAPGVYPRFGGRVAVSRVRPGGLHGGSGSGLSPLLTTRRPRRQAFGYVCGFGESQVWTKTGGGQKRGACGFWRKICSWRGEEKKAFSVPVSRPLFQRKHVVFARPLSF